MIVESLIILVMFLVLMKFDLKNPISGRHNIPGH